MTERTLREIAGEIRKCWPNPNFAAKPYLNALRDLDYVTESYGSDSAKSIIAYFLSNAGSWRGEDAKRIKAELKKKAGIK